MYSELGTFINRLIMGFDTFPQSPQEMFLCIRHTYTQQDCHPLHGEKSPCLAILLRGGCFQISSKCFHLNNEYL